jgi:hypothetical protein
MESIDMNKRRPLYKLFIGPWSLTELGLKRMSILSILLESVRYLLQGRYPDLLHPAAPGTPGWARLFYVAQIIFFLAATGAAGGHVIDAIRTRNWKNLNPVGFALYLAWWMEVVWANGYLRGW